MPSDQLDKETICVKYTGKWERITDEGTREPITMPGKCKADRDELVVVETVLTDKIDNDCYLCFCSAKRDMKFYVDGQLKKEYHICVDSEDMSADTDSWNC